MKEFPQDQIVNTERYFQSRKFIQETADIDGVQHPYYVLPQKLEARLPDFAMRMTYTGETTGAVTGVFGVSESVPQALRPYWIGHEMREFLTIGIHTPGRCAMAEEQTLASVPEELQPEFIERRIAFFIHLGDYFRKDIQTAAGNYSDDDLHESEASLHFLRSHEAIIPHKTDFRGEVRFLREDDVEQMRPVLERWIRNRNTGVVVVGEVDGVLQAMRESLAGMNNRTYLVAELEGQPIGMMGIRPPEEKMQTYVQTARPVELINAYVSDYHRNAHAGRALVSVIEQLSQLRGYEELVLNSGPRNRVNGWPAWNAIFGEPVAIATGYYGEGGDAPIWRKVL